MMNIKYTGGAALIVITTDVFNILHFLYKNLLLTIHKKAPPLIKDDAI